MKRALGLAVAGLAVVAGSTFSSQEESAAEPHVDVQLLVHHDVLRTDPSTPTINASAVNAAITWRSVEQYQAVLRYQAVLAQQAARERAAHQVRHSDHLDTATTDGKRQPTGDKWDCIVEKESGGDYGSASSNGHYGAYQFSQSTWDSTASRHGREDLVGMRPNQASASDQDQMARWLQADAGWGQWSTSSSC